MIAEKQHERAKQHALHTSISIGMKMRGKSQAVRERLAKDGRRFVRLPVVLGDDDDDGHDAIDMDDLVDMQQFAKWQERAALQTPPRRSRAVSLTPFQRRQQQYDGGETGGVRRGCTAAAKLQKALAPKPLLRVQCVEDPRPLNQTEGKSKTISGDRRQRLKPLERRRWRDTNVSCAKQASSGGMIAETNNDLLFLPPHRIPWRQTQPVGGVTLQREIRPYVGMGEHY